MSLIDLFWNIGQDRELDELRAQLERVRLERDRSAGDARTVKELVAENDELRLRLGLLLRLLISKGVITAEEYANLIAATRPRRVADSAGEKS
jgi:hypothetical protein